MKKRTTAAIIAFFITIPLFAGSPQEWGKIRKEYSNFPKNPASVLYDVTIYFLHPSIPESKRTQHYTANGKIEWIGDKGSQEIVGVAADSPEVKTPVIGTKSGFIYPHPALSLILQSPGVRFVENTEDRSVDGIPCRCFKIQGTLQGDVKERFGFVNINKATGEVVNIEFGSPTDGSSPETAYNFFFKKEKGQRYLYRVVVLKMESPDGVPFMVATDALYSNYR